MARGLSDRTGAHMKLREALSRFEEFLHRRLLGDGHHAVLMGLFRHHVLPMLGGRLLGGAALRRSLDSLVEGLAPSVDQRYPLNGFRRFVQGQRRLRSLGHVIDRYVAALRRRRRRLSTQKDHRAALVHLSRFVALEAELGPRCPAVLVRTLQEVVGRRAHHLSAVAHHLLSFLASEGLVVAEDLRPPKASRPEQRLDRRIAVADRALGFEGALGRYLRELRDERHLSLPHLLDVQARCLRFVHDMRRHGRHRPQDVESADVAAYRDRALAAGVTRTYKDLSILRGLFSFLTRSGELKENPVAGVGAKVPPRAPRSALTLPQLQALLAAPEQDLLRLPLSAAPPAKRLIDRFVALRDRLAIALLIETGLRPSELLSITIDDIQDVPSTLRVQGKGSRTTPKRTRPAYLESKTVLVALRDYMAARPLGPHRALLLNPRAEPLKPGGLCAIIRRRARQAGIRRTVRPYDLRVSFASRLVARGADPFALRALMGHDDIRTTLSLYTKLSLEEVREVWKESNPLAPQPPRRGDRT